PGRPRRPGDRRAGRYHRLCGWKEPMVVTAIVTIDCVTDSIPEVAQALADLPGVSEVYSMTGDVDLIAIVRVRESEQVVDVIAGDISLPPAVVKCDSHVALRAKSRQDLYDASAIRAPGADGRGTPNLCYPSGTRSRVNRCEQAYAFMGAPRTNAASALPAPT